MENDYTLTVRLSPPLYRKLSRYAKRMGMTYAGAVRCWAVGLSEEDDAPDMEAEYTKLIEKLTKKRDALRTTTTAARGDGAEGQGEEA